MKLFRRLVDGTYRPIERVPGGPPIPMAAFEAGEMIIIDGDDQQAEVSYLYDQMLIVRLLDTRQHPV